MKSQRPKFTFKKEPRATGLSAVGHGQQSVMIKLNKKVVGRIAAPYWATRDMRWGVGLQVEGGDADNPNCGWRWVFFKKRHNTEQAARVWLNENIDVLLKTYKLHETEDD